MPGAAESPLAPENAPDNSSKREAVVTETSKKPVALSRRLEQAA